MSYTVRPNLGGLLIVCGVRLQMLFQSSAQIGISTFSRCQLQLIRIEAVCPDFKARKPLHQDAYAYAVSN
jgi:hypothetical protein